MLQRYSSIQVEVYLKMLDDNDVWVRLSAAEALYSMGENRKSLQVLNDVIQFGEVTEHAAALNSLQRFGFDVAAARRLLQMKITTVR